MSIILLLLLITCINSLLYDKPSFKNSGGHLILESRDGKNVTLNGRYVNINGVDISGAFSLIQHVRPQLVTLSTAPLSFLLSNLTSVVQSLSSETRLAQKLDSITANTTYTTIQINSMKIQFVAMKDNITQLSRNLSTIYQNVLSEDNLNMLRNLTRNLTQLQTNVGNNGGISASEVRRINNKLNSLEAQTLLIPNLQERLSAVETAVNETLGGSQGTTTAGVNRRIPRLERRVNTLTRWVQQVRTRINRRRCASNPCLHAATCIDTVTTIGYQCICTAGWEGPNCSEDVNECVGFSNTDIGCQNGATCMNNYGSYTCLCKPGTFGVHCAVKEDSCNSNSNTEICGHGTCISSARGAHPYTCICDQGFKASIISPACIQDVDECIEGHPPCSLDPPVSCVNTYGSFQCGNCPQGYEGNGLYCRDINECEINNGGCSLYPRVECINTRPLRRCGPCPPGYTGDGIRCVTVSGPCQLNPCHALATCYDNPAMSSTYYTCTCRSGYTGNGIGHSGCTQVSGGSTGQSDPCLPNPCIHGTCSSHTGQYTCTCQADYTGSICNIALDACLSSPCLNGGSCWSSSGTFSCLCPSSHTGTRCQIQADQCGGEITGTSGIISYPEGNLQPYEHDTSCAWIIRVNITMVVNITFTHFRLEYDSQCSFDWLEIRDGPSSGGRLMYKSCGNIAPGVNGTLLSTHHALYLRFNSDHTYSNDGFTLTWTATTPECGGEVSGQDYGAISSPGYPNNYPVHRDCFWRVTVSLGKKIIFSFAAMQLETHHNCSYDRLMIYDGLRDTDPVLAAYCTTQNVPPPITSSGAEALVYFHSDFSITDTGFHLTYISQPGIPGCGGIHTTDEGEFSVPTVSGRYHSDMVCEWLIRVHPHEKVLLKFTDFRLEHHTTCGYDVVEIRDGRSLDSPLIGRYCSDDLPLPVTSSGNNLFVYFRSDYSDEYEGFTASYELACGGTYGGSTGIIHSPYFPDSYPHQRICTYIIMQPVGKAIILNFTSFDIEGPNGTCPFDYIEIRDGSRSTSPLKGRYCGQQAHRPGITYSTLNALWIKFRTDGTLAHTGFLANYTTIDTSCGGIYQNLSGTIQSPNSPGEYLGNHDCTWVIDVPSGYVVQLNWLFFSVEDHHSCGYDYVEVYDNSDIPGTGGLIGGKRYCGTTVPPMMTSLTNIITIKFHSDSSVNHGGFSITYHALHTSRFCGGSYHTSSGMIKSPLYPAAYPSTRNCIWKITVPHNRQIKLDFDTFDVEFHYDCNYDYLEIRNGGYETSPLLAKLCGENKTIDDIFSHSHQLFLKFSSDSSVSSKGFQLFWSETATGCGGTVTSVTGEIMSPGYPQSYHRRAECYWKININKGSKITLSFIDFQLQNSPNCYRDYVEVRDGSSPSSPLLGRYCSLQIGLTLNSTGQSLWIKFRGGWFPSERGFRAVYLSNCNVELTGPVGVIESPNFPNDYPHNRNCTWTIKAPLGNSINTSFSHFDVEDPSAYHSGVCVYDFVEIRVGKSKTAERIAKGHYCGDQAPPAMYSGSRMDVMEIQFKSDYSVAHNGFRMEYVFSGCGGVLTGQTGTFNSPNYPNAYPVDTVCEWHIEVVTGFRIKITINEFDIESSLYGDTCVFDSLNVYGGEDSTSPLLLHLCHHQTNPTVVETQGNYAFATIISDVSIRGRGFTASYEAIQGGCGGRFKSNRGEIHSPNYPDDYNHHSDCVWNLSVDENHVVLLNFTDFAVEPHHNCSYDYVRVFDGDSTSSPVLFTHCGSVLPDPSVVRSSANVMTVRLLADSSMSARGFRAYYKPGCGATLTANLDTQGKFISSPNFPKLMNWLQNCTWHIEAPEGYKVRLRFTHLNIERLTYATTINDTLNCVSDYVAVYDGRDTESPRIQKYCGSHIPLPVVSASRYLTLHMENTYGNGVGFRASYSALDSLCGGDLSALSGNFASPNYPDSYPPSYDCDWSLTAGPGNRIRLTFSVFNLEVSDHCNRDYVEVHQGSAAGPLLLHNCSNIIPSDLTADDVMWIRFKSDNEGTSDGFLATFTIMPGNVLFSDRGVITSPLYPHVFLRSGEFTYKIVVTPGFYVQIIITNIAVEVDPVTDVCFSSLVIHNGPDERSTILKTICGYQVPSYAITSSSNVAFVRFISNFAHEGSSFRLRFLAVSRDVMQDSISRRPVFDQDCSFNVKVFQYTTITSPGYPRNYANSLKCEWIIETNLTSILQLRSTSIKLEESEGCIYDKIDIYDGIDGTTNWNKTQTLCKRSDSYRYWKSSGRFMRIVFISDHIINDKGFKFYISRRCGGILNGPEGVIDTMIENRYRWCNYKIRVREGRTISFTFTAFRILNDTVTCGRRHLLVYNGPTDASPYLGIGRYCGTAIPTVPESSSNEVFLKYKDRYGSGNRGFRLMYREVSAACGGEHHLNHVRGSATMVEFNSPNYPHPPHPHTECSWVITTTQGKTIHLNFIDIFEVSTEYDNRCRNAYVEIRDGGTALSPLIGTYCGNRKPNTVISTDNVIYIRYYTNAGSPHSGFKMKASIGECGGTYRFPETGMILSPNYPHRYEANMNCTWSIFGPAGHSFILNFPVFSVDSSDPTCSTDPGRVVINDTLATNVTTNLCGINRALPAFESASNQITVNFTSGEVRPGVDAKFRIIANSSIEECGGTFVGDGGVFTSPGYPHGTAHKWYCRYSLKGPEGTRIKVEFEDFDLPLYRNWYCNAYLSFRERRLSPHMHATPTCRTVNPAPIRSSMNELNIYYQSYSSDSRGFKIRWSADEPQECGGDLTDSSGILESPGLQNDTLDHQMYCIWNILNPNPSNSSINITIISLQTRGCRDYLLIEPLLPSRVAVESTKLCSGRETNPSYIIIPYPNARISFSTRTTNSMVGFNLTYSVENCGGYLVGPVSVFTSPNYPQNYDANLRCSWIIEFPPGSQVELNFTDFKLENSMNHDFVRILNGPELDSPVAGQYTGQTSSNIISASNKIRVIFETDSTNSQKGFRAVATAHTRGCGGIYHANYGSITSPGFTTSSDYPSNTECRWEVRLSPGYFLTTKFVNQFDLEISPNCQNDFVQLWVSTNTSGSSTLVQKERLCGKEIPTDINSTSTKVQILFRSNNEITGRGFKLEWTGRCGGYFSDKEGVIMSPNHPMPYPNYVACDYHIVAEPGSYITLNFTHMNIFKGWRDTCYAKLIIKQHYMGYYWTNRTVCGYELPEPILLRGPSILRFLSASNYRKKTGFMLKYKIEACGGNITEPGDLTIPGEWGGYSNHMECQWDITAPPGKVVVIKFQILSLESHDQCNYDHVSVYKSLSSADDELINRYCGDHSDALPAFNTNSSSARIIFSSDYSVTRGGFKATVQFTQGCGISKLIPNADDSHIIRSPDPDGDGDYEPYLACIWNFVGNDNMVISMNFSRLEIEGPTENDTEPCPYDYVKIYDGPSQQSPLLATLCGSTIPTKAIIGTRNSLTVTFVSDSLNETSGFTATIKNEPRICGGALTASEESQSLQSPGYSQGYPILTRCFWLISAPATNGSIHIEINDFNLEESNKCTKDWVYFHEGQEDNSVINTGSIHRRWPAVTYNGITLHFADYRIMDHYYCGNHIEHSINSRGHDVGIYFNSDEQETASGFRLHYSVLNCNRTYSGYNGNIVNRKNEICYVTIAAPQGTYVSLYFNVFYFGYQTTYTFKVFDGTSDSSALLMDYSNHVGRYPSPVYASGSSMFLHISPNTNNRIYYDLSFAASDKPNGCGGNFYGRYFTFTSPNYPSEPAANQSCLYTLMVPNPYHVAFKFYGWDFTSNSNCSETYLQIAYVLESGEVAVASTLCGEDDGSAVMVSPSNRAIFNFVIGPEGLNGTGWRVSFTSAVPHQDTVFITDETTTEPTPT